LVKGIQNEDIDAGLDSFMRLSRAFFQPKNLPTGKNMVNNRQQDNTGTDTQPVKMSNRIGSIICTVALGTTHGAVDG
jgi:hypothetical protein